MSQTGKSTQIRAADARDIEFILSLVPRFVSCALPTSHRKRDVLAAIRAEIERALHDPRPGEHFFVAEAAGGQRTGFLHLQVQRDFLSAVRACHVSDLAVVEGHDGQGIGHALLEHARRWAKDHHCKLLTLSVFPGNARARALYDHAGFTPDLLRMAKPLR
ncbi:MAG TPA: GNAT family N-acetyltransferase [Rhodanobacteraceae bacterium]|nr:GNAT family N-acetyltransferase [Rhodanobacteraceae bacterium]